MLALNLLFLRPAFRQLDELAETMRRHDPLEPGRRARVGGDPKIAALADAFNELLDRLEKLGMRDRVELTRYAIRRGLVEP